MDRYSGVSKASIGVFFYNYIPGILYMISIAEVTNLLYNNNCNIGMCNQRKKMR